MDKKSRMVYIDNNQYMLNLVERIRSDKGYADLSFGFGKRNRET